MCTPSFTAVDPNAVMYGRISAEAAQFQRCCRFAYTTCAPMSCTVPPAATNMPSDRSPSMSLNDADTEPETYAPKLPMPTLNIGWLIMSSFSLREAACEGGDNDAGGRPRALSAINV